MVKGQKMTDEQKRKISESHLRKYENGFIHPLTGRPKSPEHRKRIAEGQVGNKSVLWKGEKTKYPGVHKSLNTIYGKPQYCEMCGTTVDRMYHWANISGKYLRVREDWKRLCVPCHCKFDGTTGCKRKPFTAEHLKKLSESHKGKKGYWKGRHRDTDTRRKISQKLKANWTVVTN